MNRRITSHFVISPNGFGFRSDTGGVFRLNATACEVLEGIREGQDEIQIAQRLSERHNVPLHRVRQDLGGFFEHLENLELIARHE
jgi:hypothetical protein